MKYLFRTFLFIVILLKSVNNDLFAQTYDSWIIGQGDSSTQLMELRDSGLNITDLEVSLPIESATSTISDGKGNVVLISNGCYLYNSDGEKLEQNLLSKGPWAAKYCDDYGLLCPRCMAFVQHPVDSNVYYVFVQGLFGISGQRIDTRNIYMRKVQIVNDKPTILNTTNLLVEGKIESIDIVRHGNGRDWWLVYSNPQNGTIGTILLIGNEVRLLPEQQIEYFSTSSCGFRRIIRISPNGDRIAIVDGGCGVYFYDFDRCSGIVSSRFVRINIPNNIQGRDGVFTHSGKYFLLTGWQYLQRIDISQIGVAHNPIDSFEIPAGISIHRIERFQNKLLCTDHRSERYFIELDDVENENLSIDVIGSARLIEHMRSLPLVYNKRLGVLTGSKCDSLMTSINSYDNLRINVFPNPFHSKVHISVISKRNRLKALIYNTQAQLIHSEILKSDINTIDFSGRNSGLYLVQVIGDNYYKSMKILKL